jgi:hypothetical protein
MKSIIKQIALKSGITIGATTKDLDLKSFFEKVKPVTTNHELIRLGGNEDSGYLVPNCLDGIKSCFSPGVSLEAYFENDLSKLGIRSFLADYSVEFSPIENSLFKFEKKYLGTENNEVFMTLDKWVEKNVDSDESNMILEMDIEGSEYGVIIDSSSELFNRFSIIVIEFHNLNFLFNQFSFNMLNACFDKLLKNFKIVHMHPNNCYKAVSYKEYQVPPVMEFTFLNNNKISSYEPTLKFPHELDRTNAPYLEDVILPYCWYK